MFRNLMLEEKKLEKVLVARYKDTRAASKGLKSNNVIYKRIENDRIHTNFLRVIPATIVLVIIEVCGMIWSLLANPLFNHRQTFALSCLVFIIISVAFISIVERVLKVPELNNEKKRRVYILYWLIYMTEALSFATMEYMDNKTMNNYMVFLIVFSLLPILETLPKTLLFAIAMAWELINIFLGGADLQNILIVSGSTFAAFFVSYIRFYTYVDKKLTEKKLEYSANGDSLTLLSNRRGMREYLPLLQRYCTNNKLSLLVVMVDIDDFKRFNDKYGHVNGDICLKTVAESIQEFFMRPTDICVRYGGEEFSMFCALRNADTIVEHMLHFLDKIENTEIAEGLQHITVSIGIYVADKDDINLPVPELVERADKQLYNAKKSGKNCVSYMDKIYKNEKNIDKV